MNNVVLLVLFAAFIAACMFLGMTLAVANVDINCMIDGDTLHCQTTENVVSYQLTVFEDGSFALTGCIRGRVCDD